MSYLFIVAASQGKHRDAPIIEKSPLAWLRMGSNDDELLEKIRERAVAAGRTPEESEQIVNKLVIDAVRQTTPAVVKRMLESMPAVLEANMEDLRGFDSRMRLHWGRALDLMFVVANSSLELAEDFRTNCEPSPTETLYSVLTGLFARACRVAMEVHHLLTGGFPLAAYARARTLHEIAVVAQVLSKFHGQPGSEDLADRFVLHSLILEYKDNLAYKTTFNDNSPETLDEIAAGAATQKSLCHRFGVEYKEPQGWAFNLTHNPRAGIVDLEKLTDLTIYRPHYKAMSHEVHADSASWRLNRVERNGAMHQLCGRTNIMLEDPAFLAMGSLKDVADTVMLSRYGSITKNRSLWVLEEFIAMANDALEEGSKSVADAEEQYQVEHGGEDS